MIVGLISDTHGLLRPEALQALKGVDVILHAGDVGKGNILEKLGEIAPVHAIRGNIDTVGSAALLPETLQLSLGGLTFYMLHSIKDLNIDPVKAGIDVVVYGHSHKPAHYEKGGVLYVNPSSAGRRRFSLPIGLALVHVRDTTPNVEFVDIIG